LTKSTVAVRWQVDGCE